MTKLLFSLSACALREFARQLLEGQLIDLHRQRELHQVQTYGLRGGLPVDCFYEGENMLVIHPDECIDCGVCEPECPVEAIKPDTSG